MGVDEVIERIRSMDPADRRRVQAALDRLDAPPAHAQGTIDHVPTNLDEVWALLDEGWCETGGRALSEGIDEALYGGGE
jgi:hypothetical protein